MWNDLGTLAIRHASRVKTNNSVRPGGMAYTSYPTSENPRRAKYSIGTDRGMAAGYEPLLIRAADLSPDCECRLELD